MIRETLNYLRINVVKERIQKPEDDERSIKVFNYPYQALEEAVVNALYHRDYMQREPVEITVEPDKISILSYSGPDRSISMEDINEAKALRSRRYRNRRLGDFLKELNLTEGRATGIPTIQKKLRENGSPKAMIKTDEARTFFLIIIPCRKDFVQVDAKVETATAFIYEMREESESLFARAKADDGKAVICKKVRDAFKFSDPMSKSDLDVVEAEIKTHFDLLKKAIVEGKMDVATAESDELLALISERNNKCKKLK